MGCPNILLLMTDQQRWDALGCISDWVNTPNMDRIAAEGVRFTHCVTNSPVCIPARLSLATGLYPHNTGVWDNQYMQMDAAQSTWMQVMQRAGYRTSLFGKTHLHPHQGDLRDREDLMHAYGLDDVNEIGGPRASARVGSHMTAMWQQKGKWESYQVDFAERFRIKPHMVRPSTLGVEDYADTYVGQQANAYLAGYEDAKPWCCWVSFGGPHEPWDTPEPYASLYDPASMPPPLPSFTSFAGRPLGELDKRLANKPDLSLTEISAMRADYAGNITLIDDQIGQLLQTIERRDELNNTVIILVSDHGEMNGDCGLIYKQNFLNSAVRVPLLVRTPNTLQAVSGERICAAPVEWFDVGATLVELGDGHIDYPHFSRSLVPLLNDVDASQVQPRQYCRKGEGKGKGNVEGKGRE